jgi:hypothetical protein
MQNLNYIHEGTNTPISYNSNASGRYLPMWQNAPLVSNRPTYNQNMAAWYAKDQYESNYTEHEVRLNYQIQISSGFKIMSVLMKVYQNQSA